MERVVNIRDHNYIQTERLLLKAITIDNVNSTYVEWLNDPEINKYLESRHFIHTMDSTTQYILDCLNNPLVYKHGIFDRESNRHIGNIKLCITNYSEKIGELGILVGEKEYWGQGIATEAIKGFTHYGFTNLGLKEIVAGCYQSNIASLRAFEKAGFSVSELLKDTHTLNGNAENSYRLKLKFSDDKK